MSSEAGQDQRVLITGLGAISAAGRSAGLSLAGMAEGERNGGALRRFPTELTYPVFEVNDLDEKWTGSFSRTTGLALCAAAQALDAAGLGDDLEGLSVGISIGTTVAPQLNNLEFYQAYRKTGNPSFEAVDQYLKGNLTDLLARRFSAQGPSCLVVNACSSGADAIGTAFSWIRSGRCDLAIAGGADELSLVPYCGFGAMGIVSDSLCAPFDRHRKGLNLGEGAGVMVLENEEHCRRRGGGAALYLAGYGTAGDAYHLTAPRPDGSGLETAVRISLDDAGVQPSRIAFVNAHGTATQDNDRVEGAVLHRVFGERIKFCSTKGFTGHTLGAAGGLEAVFTAAGLAEEWIPASAGFREPDDEIPIAPVREKTAVKGSFALSTSLAFGGNNSSLVIGRL